MSTAFIRLQRSPEVRAVLRRGHRRACDTAVVHVLDRGDDRPGRLAVVASKRVGNAVARNRAKRLLREAARAIGVRHGLDVALVARPATASSTGPQVTADIERLFGPAIGSGVGSDARDRLQPRIPAT